MFQTKVVEKMEKHILGSVTFFPENHNVYEMLEKYFTDVQAKDDNILLRRKDAHCMLSN